MSELEYGYFPRPSHEAAWLLETVGYVTRIWVEQEGEYDQLRFTLDVHNRELGSDEPVVYTPEFIVFLTEPAMLGFAQLQLLRAAFSSKTRASGDLVHVQFNFHGPAHELCYAYHIRLIYDEAFPQTVQGYYNEPVHFWWKHAN